MNALQRHRPSVRRPRARDRRLSRRYGRRARAVRLRAGIDARSAEAGLAAHGLELSDIRHLLLSHIHLDHAGAAGTLVRGASRLTSGSRRSGHPTSSTPRASSGRRGVCTAICSTRSGASLRPCPSENVRIAEGDVLGWECVPTRGHAIHHVSYLREGTLLAGDAAGVRMPGASYVLPVSPPPDIDVEALARDDGRDPGPRARPARAHPLRRARGCRSAPRPARCGARLLGRARARRDEPGGVRRAGSRGRGAGRRDVRPGRAVLAVVAGLRRYWDTRETERGSARSMSGSSDCCSPGARSRCSAPQWRRSRSRSPCSTR